MTKSSATRAWRWTAPVAVAGAVAAAALLPNVASGSDHPALPARSAAQLLVGIEQLTAPQFSGTVVETARLGLPALPGSTSSTDLSPQALLAGSHTVRVWYGGPERQRVALLGDLAETDLVHNGRDVWSYMSDTRVATHQQLPAHAEHTQPRAGSALTPQQAADEALRALSPTTQVSVDRTARVANRAAYQLVLVPKDGRSLISRVQIALDSSTSLPLRVQVYARGQSDPAFETGFTDISFVAPAASVFSFVPPAGATVQQGSPLMAPRERAGAVVRGRAALAPAPNAPAPAAGRQLRTIGSSWTSVAVLPGNPLASTPATGEYLRKLAKPVSGGELISLPAVSVFVADSGTTYVGAVTPDALLQVARTGRPL